ncbi:cytochrome c biogenesis protein ResB [Nocardioides dilutus]
MTATDVFSDTEHEPPRRRTGELTLRELARWSWRQLTSMRTALVLLLLLALAAVPGSVIPQQDVDALDATRWKEAHETLTPVYEKLGLFDVYGSPWFAAIYLLLVASLVGCIVPRTMVYARAIRKPPPAAPRNLTRLPDHATYRTDADPAEVLAAARAELKRRGYRLRAEDSGDTAVSAERGYLREVGNLLFHLAVLVVLVGFALGGLFGYKGGVILVTGTPFANNPTQYDDFVPGSLFQADRMDDFRFTVDDFDVEWITGGERRGMARNFNADVRYREGDGAEEQYDLRVNHPLKVGSTELFLIGHGYAPVVTVRDGSGEIAYSGPTVFLPQGPDLLSFGVIKAPDAEPDQIGLEGFLYPTFVLADGNPRNLYGAADNPLLSLNVWTGDLNMDTGQSQSVYVLDKSNAVAVPGKNGQPYRIDLSIGETVDLPEGLGSVTFEDMYSWQRIQISQTPGKRIALAGVVLALVGLMGSLFIRSRRVWVRATATDGGATLVEVAGLERSGGGDVRSVLDDLVDRLASDLRAKEKDGP